MTKIDPITLEILENALASAADEMALTLHNTAYSTVVRDCLDFSTSICNADGEMIAQGVTVPHHIASIPFAMKTLFDKYAGEMHDGDLFILNDPFDGGMHIPDIFIVKPIFWHDERVAFAVSTAHHSDLGGRVPGSAACDNTEIFQEGLRIPWLKIYHRGEPNEALFALLRANVRIPQVTMGDLRAQMAACHIGQRAVHQLIERHGLDIFVASAADLIAYTEQLVRAEIASWPDGRSSFTDYMDSDGVGGPPVRLCVTVTIEGDQLTADFTGTDPQVQGGINSTLSFTTSVVVVCVRALIRENIPNTAGMFKPLTVIAPEGTVVNGRMPAASSMRGVTGFRLSDTVRGALADLLPEKVFAAGEGGNSLLIFGGCREDQSPYVLYELITGTWGARPDRDANDGLCNPSNIASNIPIEQAECEYPVRIERYGLVRDSGGAGMFRGGMAIERQWRLLRKDAALSVRSDRRDHRPYGLQGGEPGAPSITVLYGEDIPSAAQPPEPPALLATASDIESSQSGQEWAARVLPTMVSTTLAAGNRIYHRLAGGGGWGDPLRRDPEAVASDVMNDRVSVAAARRYYGVVIADSNFEVDNEATTDLRRRLRARKKEAG